MTTPSSIKVQTSGNPEIDAQFQSLVANGLPCDLLTVPLQFPLTFQGDVAITPLDKNVQFTGDVSVPAAGVTFKSVRLTLGPDLCLVKFSLPFTVEQLVRSQVEPKVPAPIWSVIDSVLMPFLEAYESPEIIIANAEASDDELGTVSKGVNFYTTLHPSAVEPLKSLDKTFPVLKLSEKTIVLHTGAMPGAELDFIVEAQLMLNIPMGTSAVVMNDIGLMVQKQAVSVVAGATCRFTVQLGGETFVFQGGLQGESGGAVTVWGALDVPGGKWKDPFGLKGLTVNDFGAQVTTATEFPWIGLGVRGGVSVGNNDLLGAELAILYDPSAPQNTLLDVSSQNGINLPQLCAALVPDVSLGRIMDVTLDQLRLRVSPAGGTIAGKSYDKGTTISGRLDLWGYHAMVDGELDPSNGGHLYGTMDRIVIHPGSVQLLELTDVQGSGNPSVKLDFSKQKQGARISGRINVVGVFAQAVDVEADSQGFQVVLDKTAGMGIYGGVSVTYQSRRFGMVLAPRFGFAFDVLGQPINLDVGSNITIDANETDFKQSLRFNFDAFGTTQSYGPVGWDFTFTDVAGVAGVFRKFFESTVRDFFTQTLKHAAQAAFTWVRDHVTKDAQAVANLFKAAGADTVAIAQNLNRVFGQTAEQSVKLLKVGATETARILKVGFNSTAGAVTTVLKNAGYASRDVATALKDGYGATANVAAQAMKGAGYAASDVGGALKSAYGVTADQAAVILKGAGYAAGEVAGALKTAYGASSHVAAVALKGAGYTLSQVSGALGTAFNVTGKAAESVLTGAGYAADQVGKFFGDVGSALDPRKW